MSSPLNDTHLEFSPRGYRSLLSRARSERRIVTFDEIDEGQNPVLIWRHDVDFSLRAAVEIAQVDAECGIRSTFFINASADTYNFNSPFGKKLAQRILDFEHEIGIHFDCSKYGEVATADQLAALLDFEAEQFERVLDRRPSVFSFHNPNEATNKFDSEFIGGFRNCYAKTFRTSWNYASDSNGYWRFHSIGDALQLEKDRPLQVLTHPEWWTESSLQPRERLARQLFLDVFLHIQNYDEALRIGGRENRSDLADLERADEVSSGISTFQRIFEKN
jgi:hypothetical protein